MSWSWIPSAKSSTGYRRNPHMAKSIAVWRIAKETAEFRADDMTGGGAYAFGGRWNSKNVHVTYASSSIALASLETLAHIGDDIEARNRFLVQIKIPPAVWARREIVKISSLPKTWLSEPAGMGSISVGDKWLAKCASALLQVPSVIVHEEHNILINPAHPDSKNIQTKVVRQFFYDSRF